MQESSENPKLALPEGLVEDTDFENIIGEEISEGSARKVFSLPHDQTWVIKVAKCGVNGSNEIEWRVWSCIKDTDLKDKFGECRAISKSGKYLLMEMLTDVESGQERPSLPKWVTDRKARNLGVDRNGRVKVRDYGQVGDIDNKDEWILQDWPTKAQISQMEELKRLLQDDRGFE